MNASAMDVRRRLLSVDDYRLMAEAGVFAPDERVELIEGEIVVMPPIGSVHAGLIARLQKRLAAARRRARTGLDTEPRRAARAFGRRNPTSCC